ncbi:MAG: murein L,D-transpeptidase family protein [Chitinophagales bacterium]
MTTLHPTLLKSICIGFLLLMVSCNYFNKEGLPYSKTFVNENIALTSIIDSLNISEKKIQIYISKKDKELHIISDSITLKSYPVVFGFNPIDDKRIEGDGCTPEGFFEVRDRYPHKKWSKFIWINYPTKDSWRKHELSKEQGSIAETASIGGEVGIHGVPSGQDFLIDVDQNWTLGCIALKNKHINEFYPYIQKGTKIEIEGFGNENQDSGSTSL